MHPVTVLSGVIGPHKSRKFLWLLSGTENNICSVVGSIANELIVRSDWVKLNEVWERTGWVSETDLGKLLDHYFSENKQWIKTKGQWQQIGLSFSLNEPFPDNVESLKEALLLAIKKVKTDNNEW